jgi:hypothetical protein
MGKRVRMVEIVNKINNLTTQFFRDILEQLIVNYLYLSRIVRYKNGYYWGIAWE